MATQNKRTAQSGKRKTSSRRRRKGSNKNLYIGVFLTLLALTVGTVLICVLVGCGGTPDGNESDASSQASAVSEASKDESSSTVSDESSEGFDTSSESSVAPPVEYPVGSAERTRQYEEYIGKEYAIDMTEYEQYICPENESDYVFVVNPKYPVTRDYIPKDLVDCTSMRAGRSSKIVRIANIALEALLKEAAYYGFDEIGVTNAYRSYDTQNWWFNHYLEQEKASGKFATEEEAIAEVLTYSTRPGTSEHQTGLTVDMHDVDMSSMRSFNGTPTAEWLEHNAHRFGFILRYPEGKEDVTGIIYESWHFRYVGRTAATEMYEKGLTLDEYWEE